MKKELIKYLWGAAGVVALFSIYLITVFSFWLASKEYIFPGVSVAGTDLSLTTKQQAIERLKEKTKPTEIYLEDEKIEGLSLKYLPEETVDKALAIGQKNPFLLGFKEDIPYEFSFNQESLYKSIKSKDEGVRTAVVNSKITGGTDIKVVEGKQGQRLNYAQTADNFIKSAGLLNQNFTASYFSVDPAFTGSDLDKDREELTALVPEELMLKAGEKEFKINREEIISWAITSGNNDSYSRLFSGERLLEPLFGLENDSLFSNEIIANYLNGISSQINTSAVNAVLGAQDGKVVIAQAEKNGQSLNTAESAKEIITALNEKQTAVNLVIDTIKPAIRSDNLAELGLVELVSTGSSNFTGSPVNRIHNITTGASKFNGVLIEPDEEFSFNTNLGPVDASTGYLPELVILENKTQPQFGGGLCQVSSTAFRAALNAGLPITARRAHAYPVSYYKPFGVDATIYLPSPDLKFKNDTGKYILIQTRISGKNLYFDFYGTKPNRTVTFSGNETGAGAVYPVEKVSPLIYDQGVRGPGSFTAVIYRFITDSAGNTSNAKWISKYDSPDKYPH